jgi:hypothetical protein
MCFCNEGGESHKTEEIDIISTILLSAYYTGLLKTLFLNEINCIA